MHALHISYPCNPWLLFPTSMTLLSWSLCDWYIVEFHQCTHSYQHWLSLLSCLLTMNNILEQVNITSLIVDDIWTGFAGWWMKSGSTELLTLAMALMKNTQLHCTPSALYQSWLLLATGTTSASISSRPRISWWLLHLLIALYISLCVIPHNMNH